EEGPGFLGRIGRRIDDKAGAAGDGDEILAADAGAGFLGRHFGPALDLIAIGHGKFGAFWGDGAVEIISLDQKRRHAVAEIGEGPVAAIGEELGALVAELFVDIDGLVEVERIENALARDDELAVLVG